MMRRLSRLVGMTSLAAALSVAAPVRAADDDCAAPAPPFAGPGLVPFFASNTGGYHYRGLAIASPLDSPDGHGCLYHDKGTCVPYYDSPLTPISRRWCQTDCHGHPVIVPYYRGYCRWFGPSGGYAIAGGEAPCGPPAPDIGGYGPYTGAPRDTAVLSQLGGNGFLPYGACSPGQPGGPVIIETAPKH